jgi:predicted ATP-dependent endonuclease of OLD family
VILTTHSTYIVSDSDLLDIVRVDRDDLGNTRCLRLPDDYQGLEQSERILSAENAEAIFADRVVLVEGPSGSIASFN